MSQPLKSQQELYDLFITNLQDTAPQLTDLLDGSIIDGLAGVFSVSGIELQRYIILQFNKTFIDLANGPEITGGPDDLQTLVVDHFGDAFERPGAVAATDTATFSRPNNTAGAISILADSVVKTQPDANGSQQRYDTDADCALTNAGAQTFTVTSASATSGAVYSDALSNQYTVATTIAAQTTLHTTGTTLPPASGTLTKVSGTGDATITFSAVSAPDCKVSVGITAIVAGAAGSAAGGTINVIESALLDSTILVTNAGNGTGLDAEDDSSYRELIRNLIVSLRAATKAAIEATALTVAGVAVAIAIEEEKAVVFWDIGTSAPVVDAEYFYIPFVTLYVADASGNASDTLKANVALAIDPVRAFGVHIDVEGATAVTVNWTAHLALNPSGPNYTLFSSDVSQIIQSMTQYINTLDPGADFVVADANTAILALWGAAGTNDLTSFTTSVPAGDVTIAAGQKAVAGAVGTN